MWNHPIFILYIFKQNIPKQHPEMCWNTQYSETWGDYFIQRLTKIDRTADVLQQAGELCGLQTGECCLVLGDPLVQFSQFALNGLLHGPLSWLQLGVFRVPVSRKAGWVRVQNVAMMFVDTVFMSSIFLMSLIPGVLLNFLHVALSRRAHKEAIAHAAVSALHTRLQFYILSK